MRRLHLALQFGFVRCDVRVNAALEVAKPQSFLKRNLRVQLNPTQLLNFFLELGRELVFHYFRFQLRQTNRTLAESEAKTRPHSPGASIRC